MVYEKHFFQPNFMLFRMRIVRTIVLTEEVADKSGIIICQLKERELNSRLPGRFSDTVASRILSPTAWTNAGPPVTAPSF